MIKCIVSDMDGTLLNWKEEISKANKEAILEAQNKGVEFVIATGRSYVEAKHLLDEAGLECPVISINGAVIYDREGKIVDRKPMDMAEFKSVRKRLDEAGLQYEVYTNKGTFTLDKEFAIASIMDILISAMPNIDPLYIAEKARERFEKGEIEEIEDFDLLYEVERIEFYKIFVMSADLQKLGHVGGQIKQDTSLAVSSSGRENLEITSKEAQKGLAVEAFVVSKGIALSETMAMGDSYNDVSMLEKAGRPIAMGNAPSDLKKLCGEETLTNNEDGVAHCIRKALKEL